MKNWGVSLLPPLERDVPTLQAAVLQTERNNVLLPISHTFAGLLDVAVKEQRIGKLEAILKLVEWESRDPFGAQFFIQPGEGEAAFFIQPGPVQNKQTFRIPHDEWLPGSLPNE